ncbi:hypothetical protein M422DRAFT_188211, partial [Sphaerobolus stellatus SS14]
YILAAILFVLSQLDYFLLSKVICSGSNMKVDGSFIATLVETLAVVVIYLAWRSITEGMSNLLNSNIHLVAELLSSLYLMPGKTKPTTHNLGLSSRILSLFILCHVIRHDFMSTL